MQYSFYFDFPHFDEILNQKQNIERAGWYHHIISIKEGCLFVFVLSYWDLLNHNAPFTLDINGKFQWIGLQ